MPLSIRLPADIEQQIAGYGQRQGLSKSAVIVRSIQEFLARHAQPSAHDLYLAAMQTSGTVACEAEPVEADHRKHKQQVRKAIQAKHARRAAAPPPKRT